MLGIKNYPQSHVDACRRSLDAQLAAYRDLVAAAGIGTGAAGEAAIAGFAPAFFANLVLALDTWFVHRLRGVEGKDGNPINEVRVLVGSLVQSDGVLTADKTIVLKPETSVLGLKYGDRIALTEADFVALSAAFLAEIEARFVAPE